MRSPLLIWLLFVWYASLSVVSAQIVIDHQSDDLAAIPTEWILAAKNHLYIGYGHTSHGSQLTSGMNAIEGLYTDGTFDWSQNGGANELHLFEGDGYGTEYLDHDLGSTTWDEETREYLNTFPACNVIIWSWCGQVNSVDLTTHYFEPMELLEADYPSVTFIYMTGHLEGQGPDGSLFQANQQIRDYCLANNKILFDFADIEKYDPDQLQNYQYNFANDGCDYDPDGALPISYTANWADDWLTDNPSHELSQMSALCSSCAHSVSLNCVKKGIAAWHLWARIAGWNGNTNSVPVSDITISSEGNATSIDTPGGSLQLYAEVLPSNATDPVVLWSVRNGTGEADVHTAGLVTAFADGTVTITASATDGSDVSGTFGITISGQIPNEVNTLRSEFDYQVTGNTLHIDNSNGGLSSIRIIDLYGRAISTNKLKAGHESIELWHFQKGIYILQFIVGNSAIENLLISLHR